MNLERNHIYENLEVVDYTSEGQGICKVDGNVIFVKNAVLGEIIDVKIIKILKNISYGIIEKIIKTSPNREKPQCNIAYKCGGCDLFHISYEEELRFKKAKVEKALNKIGKIDIKVDTIIPSDDIKNYRNKAQFPVKFENGKAISGFYRNNSNDLVEVRNCLIQSEDANIIVKTVTEFLNEVKIMPYNKETKKGSVRHIYIRTGIDEVQVCIVTNNLKIPKLELLQEMLLETGVNITSILLNENKKDTNVILGEKYKVLYGKEKLSDILCENKFEISPKAFYQVNHNQAEKLYNQAIELCQFKGEETVLDMYCGVGTIALSIAKSVKKVIGVEIVETAVLDANQNAKLNSIENVSFICADAKDLSKIIAEETDKIDVIIVDPPRKGLDIQTIKSIISINPQKICYISCDPATLARDTKEFSQNGYQVQNAVAVDMFPRTKHVEAIIMMTLA